jgi:hypothetical protein
MLRTKVVLFCSLKWVSHMKRTVEASFCFGLVCKVVVEVQKSCILFTCFYWSHGQNPGGKLKRLWRFQKVLLFLVTRVHMYKKIRGSFLLFDFMSISGEFIAFHSRHFILLCSLIICSSLFYGETRKLHA